MGRPVLCHAAAHILLAALLLLLLHIRAGGYVITTDSVHNAAEAMMPPLPDAELAPDAGRKLLADTPNTTNTTSNATNTTGASKPVNVTALRQEAKDVLLASDAFGIVYTGGNFARAIFALLSPIIVASQTGTITVDANYLLTMSQLLSQFVATFGDLMSKGARLIADDIAPV